MARAKKIVDSPVLAVSIYQDELELYAVHVACGPRAMFIWDVDREDWMCSHCEISRATAGGVVPALAVLRVGPRRKEYDVKMWAEDWLGVPVDVEVTR